MLEIQIRCNFSGLTRLGMLMTGYKGRGLNSVEIHSSIPTLSKRIVKICTNDIIHSFISYNWDS